MKILYITITAATLYGIYFKYEHTNELSLDSVRIEFLIIPTAILALFVNHEISFMEILWTFSIYLEALAIIPQIFYVRKTGEAESLTIHYILALGSYRAFYILNWVRMAMILKESYSQLLFITDLSLLLRRLLRSHCDCCWNCSNHSLLCFSLLFTFNIDSKQSFN